MSKPVTTAAAMILHEEGKFHLDDPLSKYLPEFKDMMVYGGKDKSGKPILEKAQREITVRDLMIHTAGLTTGLFTDTPVDHMYKSANLFVPSQTLAEFTPKLAAIPLLHQPGEVFHYSISIEVLGRFVEVVSGMPLDVFMQERLFKPLGMNSTFFFFDHGEEGRLAQTYDHDPKTGKAAASIPKVGIEQALLYSRDKMKFVAGGGGLVSTLGDYLRFCQMLLNGGELNGVRVLGPKTIDLMMRDHIAGKAGPNPGGIPGYGFGLGGAILRDVAASQLPGSVGEFNWAGHASTIFWIDRKEDLSVVLMTQLVPSNALPLRKELRALVYQAVMQPDSGQD
jgi:CubicO group peptidase (beta-lactamase class C family)